MTRHSLFARLLGLAAVPFVGRKKPKLVDSYTTEQVREIWQQIQGPGFLTVNQFRKIKGFGPIEGPSGDDPFITANPIIRS
jgi:hypothetical protein